MSEIFVLCAMFFCHVFDDYFLQSSFLANGKQRKWWEENAPDEKYSLDYIMCLIMHSMSWSFSILFPTAVYFNFNVGTNYLLAFFINMAIHYIVDDLKANYGKLNLIQDQFIHIIQIAITFVIIFNTGVI